MERFLRTLSKGSHRWSALITLYYWFQISPPLRHLSLFPKGEVPQNPLQGVPLVECSHYLVLLVLDFITFTTFALIPQRRGSLKNLTEGSHLFECSLSFNLLISKFYPPTTQTFRRLIVWVGVGLGWVGGVFFGGVFFGVFFGGVFFPPKFFGIFFSKKKISNFFFQSFFSSFFF